MDRFIGLTMGRSPYRRSIRGADRKIEGWGDIKVAIIDDGIDAENESLKIAAGASFSNPKSNIGDFFVGCGG